MNSNEIRSAEDLNNRVTTRVVKSQSRGAPRFGAIAVALAITCAATAAFAKLKPPPAPQPIRMGVLPDLHLYSTRLGTSGAAFEAYLAQDPKLLAESEAILEAAIDDLIQEQVNFVIIPGDLTKDGELVNHLLMAKYLAKLERHGIQVYVVPGNHDINNHDAVRFKGDETRPVATVTPRLFRSIYQRFGYGQAIARDVNSLSYVAEPAPGLWLLAVDTCKYEESKTNEHPVVSGRIRPETMAWIQSVMQEAHAQNKQVIGFMHHGVNQHFFGEDQFFGDWLLDDWPEASVQLAMTGLKVVFTGHYHSTDAAYLVDQTLAPLSPLCDVETASLATYPCAYRLATLDTQGVLHIETRRVEDIDFDTGGVEFQDYALNAVFGPTAAIVAARLESQLGVPHAQAIAAAPLVTQAIVANYAGDEDPSPETEAIIAQLIGSPDGREQTLGWLLWGLWTDLPPGPTTDQLDSTLALPIH